MIKPIKIWLPANSLSFRDPVFICGLFLVLFIALAIRVFFYTGFFGSDEVTYLESSAKLLHGDWTPSTYIGSVRYGFQLPIAAFMYLFGQSEVSANIWTYLCSISEIAAIIIFGNLILGFRVAILAGLILAFVPLHAHYAGRIMADSPLAFFISLSFLLFWLGQTRNSSLMLFISGLAAGCVFWIKEVTVIYLFVFLSFPFIFRCWNWKWMWMLTGFSIILGANFLFLWNIAGDPLYILKIATKTASDYSSGTGRFSQATQPTSPIYYFEYLFIKVYHTWILGYLVIVSLLKRGRMKTQQPKCTRDMDFIVWWGVALIVLFSFFPVSLYPVRLISKQVNYMLIFMAPLALMAGWGLSRFRGKALLFISFISLIPAFFLTALERNVISTFTGNSKAAVELAKDRPDQEIYGSTRAQMAASFNSLVNPEQPPIKIDSVEDLIKNFKCHQGEGRAYAIFDREVIEMNSSKHATLGILPNCWRFSHDLVPISDISLPLFFSSIQKTSALILPGSLNQIFVTKIRELTESKVAHVYVVPKD